MMRPGMYNKNVEPVTTKISYTSPKEFIKGIERYADGGLNESEIREMYTAQSRAMEQLKRKDLSPKERREFQEIANLNIPLEVEKAMKKNAKKNS